MRTLIKLEEKVQEQLQQCKQTSHCKRNIELTRKILSRMKPLQIAGAMVCKYNKRNQPNHKGSAAATADNEKIRLLDSSARSQQLKGRLAQIEYRLKKEIIKAPISGTVFDLSQITIDTWHKRPRY